MTTLGQRFEYTPPAGWTEFQDGTRSIFQGPAGQQLILSGSFVSSDTTEEPPRAISDKLLADSLAVAQASAEQPDLRIIKPLRCENGLCPLPVWTIFAETIKKDILFIEAVVAQTNAILLVTLEGRHGLELIRILRQFLLTVRAVE